MTSNKYNPRNDGHNPLRITPPTKSGIMKEIARDMGWEYQSMKIIEPSDTDVAGLSWTWEPKMSSALQNSYMKLIEEREIPIKKATLADWRRATNKIKTKEEI